MSESSDADVVKLMDATHEIVSRLPSSIHKMDIRLRVIEGIVKNMRLAMGTMENQIVDLYADSNTTKQWLLEPINPSKPLPESLYDSGPLEVRRTDVLEILRRAQSLIIIQKDFASDTRKITAETDHLGVFNSSQFTRMDQIHRQSGMVVFSKTDPRTKVASQQQTPAAAVDLNPAQQHRSKAISVSRPASRLSEQESSAQTLTPPFRRPRNTVDQSRRHSSAQRSLNPGRLSESGGHIVPLHTNPPGPPSDIRQSAPWKINQY